MSDGVDARIGARVAGRFLVEERIGAGASGAVYRAVQEPLGRRVAIKLLTSTDAGDARRLSREAQAIARLRHENVVVVHDVGEDAGVPFIAMEYIEGATLRAVLDEGPLPVDAALDVAGGVARALDHAHANGVVHRDLKPQNVMLAGGKRDGAAVRVVDFGLARLTLTGDTESVSASIQGTPAYMAPEQVEPKADAAPGPPCDVYALGVVLYEALTGTNPFRAETPFKTLLRHVEGPVPQPPSTWTPGVPAAVDALVTRMLQKSPAARPTARDVLAALEAARAGLPSALPSISSTPSSASTRAPSSAPTTAGPAPAPAARAALPRVALVLAIVGAAAWGARALLSPGARDAVDAGTPTGAAVDAGARAFVVDAGAPSFVVDAGARARDVVDAGVRPARDAARAPARVLDAGTRVDVPRALPDAGSARPASALERKVRALSTCGHPCAADVGARLESALAGDLVTLKAYRADVDACRARCPLP